MDQPLVLKKKGNMVVQKVAMKKVAMKKGAMKVAMKAMKKK